MKGSISSRNINQLSSNSLRGSFSKGKFNMYGSEA